MSGPWDRPSSPSPDDQDWPAEDLQSSSAPHEPAGLWSTDEPWQERVSEPSTDWDVWPSPAPAPDDFAYEEPPPPSSDPWAESWTDEAPAMPFAGGPADAPVRDTEAPRVEPWSPSSDPWGAATVEPWTPAEPWRAEAEAVPEPEYSPGAEPSPTWTPDSVAQYESPEVAVEAEPATPPDQVEESRAAIDIAPESGVEPEVGSTEAELDEAMVHEPEAEDLNGRGADLVDRPEPPSPAVAAYERAYRSIFPTAADDLPGVAEPEPEPEAQLEPEPEPEPQLEAEPEPEPEPEPERLLEREPEPEHQLAAEPEPQPEAPLGIEPAPSAGAIEAMGTVEAPTEVDVQPVEPSLEPGIAEPAADPFAAREAESFAEPAIAPLAEPPAEPFGPPDDGFEAPATRHVEPAWEADLWGEPTTPEPASAEAEQEPDEWAARTEPSDEGFPQRERDWQPPEPLPAPGESTQVLPTSWTPPRPSSQDERSVLEPESGRIRTSLGTDVEAQDELATRPSTAEQAVPWLIGVILLLAGMVIVLLALIFAGDGSLGGAVPVPSSSAIAIMPTTSSADATATPPPSNTPTPTTSAAAAAAPSGTPTPEYGALEMVYQGRSTALAPIYLLRHDFTTEEDPAVLAQDPTLDVRRFAWAPDGTVGAGLYADLMIAVVPGAEKRNLGDNIVSLTFGRDASTLYAVRLTADAADDVATVLSVDYASGETTELASVTYTRPTIGEEDALREGQFEDDGGAVRLFWMQGGILRLWSLGAGAWDIDAETGEVTETEGLPVLWSPGGARRIEVTETDGDSTIALHDGDDEEPVARTAISGFVSHIRWSPDGERVVFTLGRTARGGGLVQDLFLWDLIDGVTPTQLTSTGAAFGAEWLGVAPRWEAEE